MSVAVQLVEGYQGAGEDRALILRHEGALVLAIADGVGGRSGGAPAAEALIRQVTSFSPPQASLEDPATWCDFLTQADQDLLDNSAVGETTAVIAAVSDKGIVGASIGDSIAWLVTSAGYVDLTSHQERKPFLGDGAAWPVPFSHSYSDETVLLASDGLWKYVDAERICAIARQPHSLEAIAKQLVDAARLPNGTLQDDVSIILCRATP